MASPPPYRPADALALLRALSGPDGIHASESVTTNYRAVFARDAMMAGVAGLLARDAAVVTGFVRTLERLRELQGREGQIASNYELSGAAGVRVSFGTLAPRLDSATWYLLGVALAARAGAVDAGEYRASLAAVVRLLDAIEYNGRHLLYVPAGGNWADEYVHEGYILYDQVLRAWALRLLGDLYAEPAWSTKAAAIGGAIATHFASAGDGPRHPVASFTPAVSRDVFDLAAVSLLALSNVAPAIAAPALEWVAGRFLQRGELPPAFYPVIEPGHADWAALSRYHLHGFRNRPHEYHNGGVWPVWLGWLALALGAGGRADDLALLRAAVDARLDGRFDFHEFLHGTTGAPGGTTRMAYSATGLLFLAAADDPAAATLLDA